MDKHESSYPDDPVEPTPVVAAHPALPYHTSPRRRSTSMARKLLGILIVLVVVGALGGGGYYYYGYHRHHTVPKSVVPQSAATSQSNAQAPTTPSSAATQHYVSSEKTLSLEFDYPANWKVTPATTTSTGTDPITIDSTSTTIKNAAGESATGKVTITMRPGGGQIDELSAGSATAGQDSVQIGYAHPTAHQHQYPYLTFIHLPGSTSVAGAFEEVMVTGITQFKKGDPITTASLTNLDPVISAAFYRCTASSCGGKGAGSLSITANEWQTNPVLQQVQGLMQSLKIN